MLTHTAPLGICRLYASEAGKYSIIFFRKYVCFLRKKHAYGYLLCLLWSKYCILVPFCCLKEVKSRKHFFLFLSKNNFFCPNYNVKSQNNATLLSSLFSPDPPFPSFINMPRNSTLLLQMRLTKCWQNTKNCQFRYFFAFQGADLVPKRETGI